MPQSFDTLLNLLYEPETKKKLSIMKALEYKNDWMDLEELHLSLGYTTTTLKKYLTQFEKEQKKNNGFSFKFDKKRGYSLEIENKFEFGQYYRDILFDMWPVQFLAQLILHNKVNKAIFPIEFFISESALKNKIKDFRKILNFFSITLKIRNGIYYLEGNEANIRRVSEDFFWQFFKGSSWPFEAVEEQSIKAKATQLLQKSTRPFSLIDQRKMHYALAVQEIRVKCGQPFKTNSSIVSYFPSLTPFIANMQQNKTLFPTEAEFYYFYFRLATSSKYYSYFDTDFNAIMLRSDKLDAYAKLNIRILTFVTETIGPLSQENTYNMLNYLFCTHMHLILFNNSYTINRKKISFFNQKNIEPIINKIITLIKKEIPLNEEIKNFLIYRYNIILSTVYPPSAFSRKIVISFCTDIDPSIEAKLLRILTDYFCDIVNIVFYSGVNNITEPIDLLIHTALNPEIWSDKSIKATRYVDTRFLYNNNLSPLIDIIYRFLTDEIFDLP
ncbi:hypothetical protein UAW_00071 [Enterococcus haemoperoxidus ATCC BAA-382]|uniref:Mga helix-turn-helix domain-containing protein n=2 Tax=Enterococcus haemoperoxidus TaxID=155618 RepID=R2T6W5_9ENTE|nr:helix-turn-helix domain-containing protein [Enterococcus haemoperoxidus]EOI00804.1 hypothetical protein UAW_00071 [Enterococcus haemoperoxidus ATCC BAA-382]EOT62038.1 hypothetical protein I583_01038 [Enterococcus haemoperoxidus ATCC BAA-382]OJG52068.1 hypothetical protein RV06_GL001083 [Enterococcus haemoperoxidus]